MRLGNTARESGSSEKRKLPTVSRGLPCIFFSIGNIFLISPFMLLIYLGNRIGEGFNVKSSIIFYDSNFFYNNATGEEIEIINKYSIYFIQEETHTHRI